MTPDRRIEIGGKKVEEYYWAGEYVVYIDGHLFNGNYDTAIKSVTPTPSTHPASGAREYNCMDHKENEEPCLECGPCLRAKPAKSVAIGEHCPECQGPCRRACGHPASGDGKP
jgi:hypothetical protein